VILINRLRRLGQKNQRLREKLMLMSGTIRLMVQDQLESLRARLDLSLMAGIPGTKESRNPESGWGVGARIQQQGTPTCPPPKTAALPLRLISRGRY
jgi:hypothetical protein